MSEAQQLPIRLRGYQPGDANFIYNSWLRSNRQNTPYDLCENPIYFTEHHKLIERLLKDCKTVIACSVNDVAEIYGYICYQEVESTMVFHYAYVKHTFRNLGIAKELVAETGHDLTNAALFTQWTKGSAKLMKKYNLLFHPYILTNYNK